MPSKPPNALFLQWLGSALAIAPTTEPVEIDQIWIDSGVVKLSLGSPPTITSHPENVVSYSGATATFTVAHSGSSATYQWQKQENSTGSWANVSGATSASYTTGALAYPADNNDAYRCVVTNSNGSATSNSATLTVYESLNYQVRGFTNSNYFRGPEGSGLAKAGTIRVIFKLLSLPTNSQKVIAGRLGGTGSGGWGFTTGYDGASVAADKVIFFHRVEASGTSYSPAFTFVAGDVGKHFVLHATATNSILRMYVGGMEVGTGGATSGNLQTAISTTRLGIGIYTPSTTLSNDHVAVVHLETTATVMTAAQILADAQTIQDLTTDLRVPPLPSAVDRFDADDIASATDWVARTGGFTLTRSGSLTVEAF